MAVARPLHNLVAMITGSTSGIGRGVAHALASRGCNVILSGLATDENAQTVTKEFTQYGVRSDCILADLSSQLETETLCMEALKLYPNGVDIIVNNAGFLHSCPFDTFPQEAWDATLSAMLTAPFIISQRLLPKMKEKGWGRLINMSSVAGVVALQNRVAYVAAKHALVGLTKAVAIEMAGSGVTCNVICPGSVNTPIVQGLIQTLADKQGIPYEEAKRAHVSKVNATGQLIEVEHIAEMVAFLCTDAASQMTGSTIMMDGGGTAR